MISDTLNKLKWHSIMTGIILAAIGLVMVTCPEPYMLTLISALGAVMLIAAVVLTLEFISSKKSLMDYVRLIAALLLGIAGAAVLAYEADAKVVISVIRGLYLLLFGLFCMYHAFVFARRSGRKGWWVLVILSAIMLFLGVMSFVEPGSTFEEEFRNTGWVVIFSAVVSGLRRVWLFSPNRKAKAVA